MFDLGLHFRFLQKATEAFFEMSQASVAATLAWQSRLHDEMTSIGRPATVSTSVWPTWFGDWTPANADPFSWSNTSGQQPRLNGQSAALPWQMWFQGAAPPASPMADWVNGAMPWQAMFAFGGAMPAAWAAAMTPPIWGASPWSLYQGPMVAIMLSYGVPYSVAAPAARASTSAMDAADAACTQWRLVFGNDNERPQISRNATWPPWPTIAR